MSCNVEKLQRDYIITFAIIVPFIAIGIPIFIIFDVYQDIGIVLKIAIFIISFIFFYLVFFFGTCFFSPAINEAIIKDYEIIEKKLWWRKSIQWNEIIEIYEQPLIGLAATGGKRILVIRARSKSIKFSDKIDQYEKLREIILERSDSKNFKHKAGWVEEWIK